MSGQSFPISNEKEYCFKPTVCTLDKGHLVVWASGLEQNNSKLWCKLVPNGADSAQITATNVGSIGDTEDILFLQKYNEHTAVLAVETTVGARLYFINDDSELMDTCEYTTVDDELLFGCHIYNNVVYLFCHSYKYQRFAVREVPFGDDWNEAELLWSEKGAYGIPVVNHLGEGCYSAGWITENDELVVYMGQWSSFNMNLAYCKLVDFDVDYLIGGRVTDNVAVYGGYSRSQRELRLNYYTWDVLSNKITATARYWKSKDYHDKAFYIYSSTAVDGFMLVSDYQNDAVRTQRFTQVGSFLYPLIKADAGESWDPHYSEGLLVYIKELDNRTLVYGRKIPMNPITELDGLALVAVEERV